MNDRVLAVQMIPHIERNLVHPIPAEEAAGEARLRWRPRQLAECGDAARVAQLRCGFDVKGCSG